MKSPKGELARFIYEKCYDDLLKAVYEWVEEHPNSLELWRYPFDADAAVVEDMLIEFTTNVSVVGDVISCDVIVSCDPIVLQQKNYHGDLREKEVTQWFRVRCEIVVEDRVKKFAVKNIAPYEREESRKCDGKADNNLVPIIGKKNLDEEATKFLEEYCKEALENVMPVPIEKIVKEEMKLEIIHGGKLTDDLGVFGQICFSVGKVKVHDMFKDIENEIDVTRGTIIIDVKTFWERNLGCVNNTIAHEAFHWHKHRVYAAVRSMLNGEKFVAQRCPSSAAKKYDSEEEIEWTDTDRMEWQANHVAPRILMPVQTVKPMVEELLAKYAYEDNPSERTMILECVIDELASFYKVSKQAAKIRMVDLGYTEANGVYNFDGYTNYFNQINRRDAFYQYCDNAEFRTLIDSGKFRYIDGYYVIDDEKYLTETSGEYLLTDYALKHLDECTLSFTYRRVNMRIHGEFHSDIFHRENAAAYAMLPEYDGNANVSVIDNVAELQRRKAKFEAQFEDFKATSQSFSEIAIVYTQRKKWNSVKFKNMTLLDDSTYSKIVHKENKNWAIETIMAIAVGLGVTQETGLRMLAAAGHTFGISRTHRIYAFILSDFYGYPIDEVNEFLISEGEKPLGNKPRKGS
ncbi:hypothetical protein AGMMS49975_09540 [Clostridia bacterium]|nr:hypothetical protein AGMMS49975_09540 [Clostridia bacterium]